MEVRALVGNQRTQSQPKKCPTFVNEALQSHIQIAQYDQINESYYKSQTDHSLDMNTYVLPRPLYTASQSVVRRPKKSKIGSLYSNARQNTINALNANSSSHSHTNNKSLGITHVQQSMIVAKVKPEPQPLKATPRDPKYNINIDQYHPDEEHPYIEKKIQLDLTDVVKRQSIDIVESNHSMVQLSDCPSAHSNEEKQNYHLKPKGLLLIKEDKQKQDGLMVPVSSDRSISQAAGMIKPISNAESKFHRSQTDIHKLNMTMRRSQPLMQNIVKNKSPQKQEIIRTKVQKSNTVENVNNKLMNNQQEQPEQKQQLSADRTAVNETTKSTRRSVIKNTSNNKLSTLSNLDQQVNVILQQEQMEEARAQSFLKVPDNPDNPDYQSKTKSYQSRDKLNGSISHTPPDWSAIYLDIDTIQKPHQRTKSFENPTKSVKRRRQQSQALASKLFQGIIQVTDVEQPSGREMIFSQSMIPDKTPTPAESSSQPTSQSIQIMVKNTGCGTDELENLMFEDKMNDQISSHGSSDVLGSSISNTEDKSNNGIGMEANMEQQVLKGEANIKSRQCYSRNTFSRQQGIIANTRVIFKSANGQNKIIYFDQAGKPNDLAMQKNQKTERMQIIGDHIRPLREQSPFQYFYQNIQASNTLQKDASIKMSQSFYDQTARALTKDFTKNILSQYLDNPQTISDPLHQQENMIIQDDHRIEDSPSQENRNLSPGQIYHDEKENNILTSKKHSVDQLSVDTNAQPHHMRSNNLSFNARTVVPTVLITASQSLPHKQGRNVIQSKDLYSNMQGKQLFTNTQIQRAPLLFNKQRLGSMQNVQRKLKEEMSDIDTLRMQSEQDEIEESVKQIMAERQRLQSILSVNKSFEKDRSYENANASKGGLFAQISNQFRNTQNKWSLKVDKNSSQILEMKERPSIVSFDMISKRQSLQYSLSPEKFIKLNYTAPFSTSQNFNRIQQKTTQDVSNTYLKYLQAEKNLSRKDRVLYNLDKPSMQTRAYPFIIPKTTKIFKDRKESYEVLNNSRNVGYQTRLGYGKKRTT